MAAGLRLRGVQTPTSFPFARNSNYDVLIGGDAATKFWLSPAPGRVTISDGYVTSGTGRGPAVAFNSGPAPRGPSYVAASIGGAPSLYFALASERRFLDVADVLPVAGDFTVLALLALDAATQDYRRIISTTAGGDPRFRLDVLGPVGGVDQNRLDAVFRDGDGSQARALTPVGSVPQIATTVVAMACWDAGARTLHVSSDFGLTWASNEQPAFDPFAGPMSVRIGAENNAASGIIGGVLNLWIGNVSLKSDTTRLALHREFFADKFGLDYTA